MSLLIDTAKSPRSPSTSARPDFGKIMAVFLMLVATAYFGRDIVLPITLAFVLAFILAPLVDRLTRWRLGRIPSVLLGVVFALGVVAAIGGIVGTQVAALTNDLPQYATTIEKKVNAAKAHTIAPLSRILDRIGPHGPPPASNPAAPAGSPQAPDGQPAGTPQQQAPESPLAMAERWLEKALSPLATLGIVFVVAIFALLQREDLRNRLVRLVGARDLHHTTVAIDDAACRLRRYFLMQLTVNAVFAVVIGLGLLAIGVPNPVLWGLLSGLLRFVPYVGAILSAIFPMVLAAAVAPGWHMMLWTGALYLIIEPLTGQFIEPMIYGNHTGLSPFSVVIAAIFWSWLWGPVGLILSTPLTLCLVVIGRHAPRLEFLDVMLGDRPPLSPVEAFYQRLLAGDADEALDQAETMLKDRSLTAYYDEVALEALRIAARDAKRGALNADQLACIKTAVEELVDGLEGHDDRPETSTAKPALACVSGRSPLDEAATAMLVQLLGKQGIPVRSVRFEDLSRDRIAAFDFGDIKMACVCYLDAGGRLASLRYLIQRMRERLPSEVPVLVGLSTTDLKADGQLGVDFVTASLAQTVECCLAALPRPVP